ncbi:MAG: hypothetical protein R6U26_02160 [Candidatus Undinarchaeales archaeon]
MRFKFLEKPKQREIKDEEPPEFLEEKKPKKKDLTKDVLNYLKAEFKVEKSARLKTSPDSDQPPLSILHAEDQTYSMWHRMPIRGESGIVHIPDFVIFKGTRRMAPRDKNPDVLIECRRLDENRSNRTDSRVVREMVGASLDILPGLIILVTNRPLSEYAKAIAKHFGIEIVDASKDSASYDLFKVMVSNDLQSREKLYSNLDKNILKLEGKFKVAKAKASASGSNVKVPDVKPSRSELRDLIAKALETTPNSAKELSNVLQADPNLILNELYALEREGRAKVAKRTGSTPKEFEWKLGKSSK